MFFGTMMRLLAQQKHEVVKNNSHRFGVRHSQLAVSADILDSTAGIILDSAPARLTPDVASRQARLLPLYSFHRPFVSAEGLQNGLGLKMQTWGGFPNQMGNSVSF